VLYGYRFEYSWGRGFNKGPTLSEKVEYRLKEGQITHQILRYPRFLKLKNIGTEVLFITSQSQFQYVQRVMVNFRKVDGMPGPVNDPEFSTRKGKKI
jgi:hypothetical protein